MKILIVADCKIGERNEGGSNRILGLAKALSKYVSVKVLHQGHDMAMGNIKFINYKPLTYFLTMRTHHWVIQALTPYSNFINPDLYRKIEEMVVDADVIQVEGPYSTFPALVVAGVINKKSPFILDEHNMEFLTLKSKIKNISINSITSLASLPYIFLSEKISLNFAHRIICVSEIDKQLLVRFYKIPVDKIVVVPNGVDISMYENVPPLNNPNLNRNKIIFFHGTLSWYPNLEATNIIVNFIAPNIPEATFLIAGANPPLSLIRKIEKTKNVKYLGYVENLEGWIKASNVCIAPILRGGGTKLKVLEYAAAGKPIIATFKAVEGLGMINNVHGLFYDNINEDFVSGIRRILNCEQLAHDLGQNAKQLAKKYDWTVIGKKLYETYCELVN